METLRDDAAAELKEQAEAKWLKDGPALLLAAFAKETQAAGQGMENDQKRPAKLTASIDPVSKELTGIVDWPGVRTSKVKGQATDLSLSFVETEIISTTEILERLFAYNLTWTTNRSLVGKWSWSGNAGEVVFQVPNQSR